MERGKNPVYGAVAKYGGQETKTREGRASCYVTFCLFYCMSYKFKVYRLLIGVRNPVCLSFFIQSMSDHYYYFDSRLQVRNILSGSSCPITQSPSHPITPLLTVSRLILAPVLSLSFSSLSLLFLSLSLSFSLFLSLAVALPVLGAFSSAHMWPSICSPRLRTPPRWPLAGGVCGVRRGATTFRVILFEFSHVLFVCGR